MAVIFEVLTWEENTKYSKEWKGNFGNWGEDHVPDISCPWRPSDGWVMMVVAWWGSEVDSCGVYVPKWAWKFNKLRSCWYFARVRFTFSSELLVTATVLAKELSPFWPMF